MWEFRAIVVCATWMPPIFMACGGDFNGAWAWLWRAIVVRLAIAGACAEVESVASALRDEN